MKCMQTLLQSYYQMLLREIKEIQKERESKFMDGRLNIVDVLILPKWVYRFNVILIKNSDILFVKWK